MRQRRGARGCHVSYPMIIGGLALSVLILRQVVFHPGNSSLSPPLPLPSQPLPYPPPPHSLPLSLSKSYVVLSNGVKMPRVGFGTAGLGEDTKVAVTIALATGYRLLDSAQAREWYREDMVGEAVKLGGVKREELFLVSKLHPRDHGHVSARQRFHDSLRDLGTDHLDLFLLHYPVCFPAICSGPPPKGTWRDSWRALEELYREGRIRAIGVSNFNEQELRELLTVARVGPHVMQRNSDPLRSDRSMQVACSSSGIRYTAYSSLGSQWQFTGRPGNPVLQHSQVKKIASARNCSAAQVVLKWALLQGQSIIPRSHNKDRILENLKSPYCPLYKEDMIALDRLDGTEPEETI